MEFKELMSVKFPGSVNVKHSTSWSEDDKIALVTSKGVNILEFYLCKKSSATELEFKRHFIEPPSVSPTHDTDVKTVDIFAALDKSDVYQMMWDPLLFSGIKGSDVQPVVTQQVSWSAAGMRDFNGCLLALLQSTGSIVIYSSSKSSWGEVVNISQLWLEHLKTITWRQEKVLNEKSSNPSRDQFIIHCNRVEQIEATAITWSHLMKDVEGYWSLLLVAHRNKTIVAWKIMQISFDGKTKNKIEPTILFQCTIEMGRICHLSWSSFGVNRGFIVAGDIQGVVKSILVEDVKGCKFSGSENLWKEKDKIAVSHVMILHYIQVHFVVIVKGACLVTVAITDDGALIAQNALPLGTLDITGIQAIDSKNFVVCTQCGLVKSIEIIFTAGTKELELNVQKVPTKFDSDYATPQGIVLSRNKVIWGMTTTIFSLYDHLCLREPTELLVFTYTDFNSALNALQTKESARLFQNWDYLELVRILGNNISWEVELKMKENGNVLNLTWWLLLVKQMQNSEEDSSLKISQKRLEAIIFSQHACKVLSTLPSRGELSEDEWQSAALLRKWLQNYSTTEDGNVAATHGALQASENIVKDCKEICHICGNNVPWGAIDIARCTDNHSLPRCSISLLACSSLPLRSCRTCKLLTFHRQVFVEDAACLYCSRPLDLDDEFL